MIKFYGNYNCILYFHCFIDKKQKFFQKGDIAMPENKQKLHINNRNEVYSLYDLLKNTPIKEILEAFSASVNLPVRLIDADGQVVEASGKECEYCRIFRQKISQDISCDTVHRNASTYATEIGECYIFQCHANLNHIVFPLTKNGVCLGSVLAGPFLMDKPDALLVSELSQRYPISGDSLLELYEEAANVPVLSPAVVTQVSRLIYYLFSGLPLDESKLLSDNKQKYLQQSLIFDSLQRYKTGTAPAANIYPYEKENELISKVKLGNVSGAKAILNDLLGYVLFSEGSSLDSVKTRAIELSTLLSRAAIEGGAATDTILKINNLFLKSLQEVDSQEALCYKLQEIVITFTESLFSHAPSSHPELMKKALSFISKNFSSPLSLEQVAGEVHLNPSYFSTIFKKSCGSSFKEYLNLVRIEESKRLLSNTNYSIIDIAIAVGFEDQSYFCKVFKKYTGLTPTGYR